VAAARKNLNEDKHKLSAAKCRSMTLLARNIKCMRICAGVPSERGVMILATYTCVQIVLLDRIKQSGKRCHVVYQHCVVI